MKPEDLDIFMTIVKQRSGLVLTRDKAYLLESRLLPVARKYNLKSLADMAQLVRNQRDERLMGEIAEAMTTNESFFFRDRRPFTLFQKVLLPHLLKTRADSKRIRIWSAAASSGQEAYSLAMICAEEADALRGWAVEIAGTDISNEMVERAQSGIYSHFEVQRGLPIRLLVKYFQQSGTEKWQIKEELRRMVQFRAANLLHDFGPIGTFDVVYCRNVLIYFDAATKTRVLDALGGVVSPDGALVLGGAETVLGVTEKFKPLDGTQDVYVPVTSPGFSGASLVAV
ncbi:MAG: protein-glutamate O-methyltransferase CheR [Pseudomonadota bacterium]|nr:protein-glutamate O-methyltransferase CheR [Pseudomonadota bacterium]